MMYIYLVALGVFALGSVLLVNTSIHQLSGGTAYERARIRRYIGAFLMVGALLFAVLKTLQQFLSPSLPEADSAPTSSGSTQARIAPAASPSNPDSHASILNLHVSTQAVIGVRDMSSQKEVPPPETADLQAMDQPQHDAELDKANASIRNDPMNPNVYLMRASIEYKKKLWARARKDFQTALGLDGPSVQIKFDMAEIYFAQNQYDDARPGFSLLEQDPTVGDFAKYKCFLCDLYGGHEDVADKELNGFTQNGSSASYYFANVAWSLYHHKIDVAQDFLNRAQKKCAPEQVTFYQTSLYNLGYLPLPP